MKEMFKFFILGIVLFVCTKAQAQSYIQVTDQDWYNPETQLGEMKCDNQSSPFPIDWDGDGDIDIVSGGNSTEDTVCYFENDGEDNFELAATHFGGLAAPHLYVIDWDSDGFLDIFTGGYGLEIEYHHNDGTGGYRNPSFVTTPWFTLSSSTYPKIEIIDWDGDGGGEDSKDLDFVIGKQDGTLSYFECQDVTHECDDVGDYPTEETNWQGINVDGGAAPSFGDWDEDGDSDLLMGDGSGPLGYFENEEDLFGSESDIFADLLIREGTSGMTTPRFVDWDGDGHLDIVSGMAAGYFALFIQDADDDGYIREDDCDNDDALVNVNQVEVCDRDSNESVDGIDDDCDGLVDENSLEDPSGYVTDGNTYYLDSDGDGYGDEDELVIACENPSTSETIYVENANDCDDGDATVNPDADEVCDEVDNDCDGETDENDAIDVATWYLDNDGDGLGDPEVSSQSCNAPTGFVSDNTDCDDSDETLTTDCPEDDNDNSNNDDSENSVSKSGGCSLGEGQSSSREILISFCTFLGILAFVRKQKVLRKF